MVIGPGGMIQPITLIDKSLLLRSRSVHVLVCRSVANSGKTRMRERTEQVRGTCPRLAFVIDLSCPHVQSLEWRHRANVSMPGKHRQSVPLLSIAFELPHRSLERWPVKEGFTRSFGAFAYVRTGRW
jgi:hypothetical protein